MLTEFEVDSTANRQTLVGAKDEIRIRHPETQSQVDQLELKAKAMESKLADLLTNAPILIQNIRTATLNPHSFQGRDWKANCNG